MYICQTKKSNINYVWDIIMSLCALRAYSLINNKDLVNVDDPHIFVCNKAEVKYLF